jgi:hypothetical protein
MRKEIPDDLGALTSEVWANAQVSRSRFLASVALKMWRRILRDRRGAPAVEAHPQAEG